MIARIRKGNDFHVAWRIKRGGVAENLENVTNIKLERTIYGVTTEHTLFTVSGDTITAEIPAEVQTHNGQYKLTLSYELVDTGMSDDDRKCKVAIYAFAIVDPLGPADDLLTVNVSSDVTIGLKGDKGLSAYQVWLENGNVGTEDDYLDYLRQPATDAATTANTAAGNANDAATAANTAAGTANDAASLADQARLAIETELGEKAAHGYDVEETPKTLKEVEDEFKSTLIVLENLLENGDFSDGLNGWTRANTNLPVIDGVEATFTTTGGFGFIRNTTFVPVNGHKFYVSCMVKTLSSNARLEFRSTSGSSSNTLPVISHIGSGDYERLSEIATPNQAPDEYGGLYIIDFASVAGATITIKEPIVIDLTTIFGAGNEPSKTVMDALIDEWFDNDIVKSEASIIKEQVEPFNQLMKSIDGLAVKVGASIVPRTIKGTTSQIQVTNGNGASADPTISIAKNADPFVPEIYGTEYGPELAPDISTFTPDGAVWNSTTGAWELSEGGTLSANVNVVEGQEYEISLTTIDSNTYSTTFPLLVVSLGTVISQPQFGGWSDALNKFTLIANETGSVELKIGDGVELYWAHITEVSVRAITQRTSRAGRIGTLAHYVYQSNYNLAIGGGHQKRTSGDRNNAIGILSQENITTGMYNNAIGQNTQRKLTSGRANVAMGEQAQRSLETGYYNIGIGYAAQGYLTSGSWNTGIGNECQLHLTSGCRNVAVGARAQEQLTTGHWNVAMGREAAWRANADSVNATVTASFQTTIGSRSGQISPVQSDYLSALGYRAVGTINSTAIGSFAKAGGIGSVAIGLDSDGVGAEATSDNEFVLGTSKHHVKVPGRINIAQFTPSGSADPQGEVGDITSDDDYIYAKTATGWKRAALVEW